MKRLFILLFTLCTVAVASAQMEQAIIIDQSTFKDIQSSTLSGVNIDPIGIDTSRRKCARIKMKVNRMTREEIDGLEIRIRTNNECIKCKTADYDNGLIIEMTAKADSRFYLHHDKFGDSNEVKLNLEADREYYIEASLNQQFSVNILSNVENADVYIDNNFFGKTNKDGILTCEGLLAGEHKLKLVYSGIDYNQNIVVSSANIIFIQNVDIKSSSSQYLIIKTTPSNALVQINGEDVENSKNGASKILKPGVFTYTVTANNYHPKSGVGTMRGEQIIIPVELDPAFGYISIKADSEYNGAQVYVNNSLRGTLPLDKNIIQLSGDCSVRIVKSLYKTFEKRFTMTDGNTEEIVAKLTPNFAEVTLKAESGVAIWVDNSYKSLGSWSGKLEIGDHIIECRKDSYVSNTQTISINSSESVTHTLDSLKPIYGSLNINSNPIGATIKIDGVKVGETPLIKNDVLVGTRKVEISMNGYNDYSEIIEVVEGEIKEIKPDLNIKGSKYSTSSSPSTYPTTTTKTRSRWEPFNGESNIFQVGTGLSFGWGAHYNTLLSVPIDLRLGTIYNLFNFIATAKFNQNNIKESLDKDEKDLVRPHQWAVGGTLRTNIIRDINVDDYSLFVDLGAYYNFNTTVKGSGNYESSIVEVVNKNTTSIYGAVGLGGYIELSLYFQYNLNPITNLGNSYENDDNYISDLKESNFNIGLALRIYFNSGLFAK